jgi:hypothetical protein
MFKEILMRCLGQRSQWFCERVFFISWGKHWKGVYLHFLPMYCYRLFLWGWDRHRKNPFGAMCKRADGAGTAAAATVQSACGGQ